MSRRNTYMHIALTATMAIVWHFGAIAQQKEFDTIQVNVITRFKPTIHDAVKLNSTPPVADSVCLSRNVKYDFVNSQYPTSYTPPQIPAMQIKGEPPET